jgi:hypothetical protein
VTFSPSGVTGESPATGTIWFTAAVLPAGAVMTLSSDNPGAASVPTSITVPGGATSVTFPVTTSAVADPTPVVITVTGLGTTKTATLLVLPAEAG